MTILGDTKKLDTAGYTCILYEIVNSQIVFEQTRQYFFNLISITKYFFVDNYLKKITKINVWYAYLDNLSIYKGIDVVTPASHLTFLPGYKKSDVPIKIIICM